MKQMSWRLIGLKRNYSAGPALIVYISTGFLKYILGVCVCVCVGMKKRDKERKTETRKLDYDAKCIYYCVLEVKMIICGGLDINSGPTLCDPMNYSPAGSSVHGISQARILQWVAISISRVYSWPRDQAWVSCIADSILPCRRILYWLSHQGSLKA